MRALPHQYIHPRKPPLHLLKPKALLGLGVGKGSLLLGCLSTSHGLADAKAGRQDARGNRKYHCWWAHGLDPRKLVEQPTFCSVVWVRRNEGKPHPPQPFDMYHVTGICEIEKDPIPALDPIQVRPGFP